MRIGEIRGRFPDKKIKNSHGRRNTENTEKIYLKALNFRVFRGVLEA